MNSLANKLKQIEPHQYYKQYGFLYVFKLISRGINATLKAVETFRSSTFHSFFRHIIKDLFRSMKII